MLDIVLLVCWIIIGLVNLCSSEPISKLSYFLVWILVIVYFISRIVT